VVLLTDKVLDITDEQWQGYIAYEIGEDNDDIDVPRVRESLGKLIAEGELWEEDGNYGVISILARALDYCIIATLDGGPEDGRIVAADREIVKKVLE